MLSKKKNKCFGFKIYYLNILSYMWSNSMNLLYRTTEFVCCQWTDSQNISRVIGFGCFRIIWKWPWFFFFQFLVKIGWEKQYPELVKEWMIKKLQLWTIKFKIKLRHYVFILKWLNYIYRQFSNDIPFLTA